MCKINPITKEDIDRTKAALLKRLQNPSLTDGGRQLLEDQYNYIVENVREREGTPGCGHH